MSITFSTSDVVDLISQFAKKKFVLLIRGGQNRFQGEQSADDLSPKEKSKTKKATLLLLDNRTPTATHVNLNKRFQRKTRNPNILSKPSNNSSQNI